MENNNLENGNTEIKHKRRKRYSGTHPVKFKDKYKELNPDKYPNAITHAIEKGNTPAGMHISIFVKEILNILKINHGEVGLDCTLGYGGHSERMLEALEGEGHLFSIDIDPIEIQKTTKRLRDKGFSEEILTTKLINFANIEEVAKEEIVNKSGGFDFVLADLGVSSMQIDNPERGFTFKKDGPLDLRMNPKQGITAAERLKDISKEELEGMLIENADEPFAAEIANAIKEYQRKGNTIETTIDLKNIIEEALKIVQKSEREEAVKKSSQRVFQAIRIDINHEYESLYNLLEHLPKVLKSGGRVVILTFHSGEDRLVKKSFKAHLKSGDYKEVSKDAIRPSKEECKMNPRARTTKLRWAIKE
ncbi:MAG: 16S rRNA (cytosine(1402)-N(4))-methyltransferase RsmH [Suipraeoptans sp.]